MSARLPSLGALSLGTRVPARTGVVVEDPDVPTFTEADAQRNQQAYLQDGVARPVRVQRILPPEMDVAAVAQLLDDVLKAEELLERVFTIAHTTGTRRDGEESPRDLSFARDMPYPRGVMRPPPVGDQTSAVQLYELMAARRRTVYERLVQAIEALLPLHGKSVVRPATTWFDMKEFVHDYVSADRPLHAFRLRRYFTKVPFQMLAQGARDPVLLKEWMSLGDGQQRENWLNCELIGQVLDVFGMVAQADHGRSVRPRREHAEDRDLALALGDRLLALEETEGVQSEGRVEDLVVYRLTMSDGTVRVQNEHDDFQSPWYPEEEEPEEQPRYLTQHGFLGQDEEAERPLPVRWQFLEQLRGEREREEQEWEERRREDERVRRERFDELQRQGSEDDDDEPVYRPSLANYRPLVQDSMVRRYDSDGEEEPSYRSHA